MPHIQISPGELLDKISILEIKRARIKRPDKHAHVAHELSLLSAVREREVIHNDDLDALMQRLREVNEALWDVEDALRRHERDADFGPTFVALARKVYLTNDERAALKRRINEALHSAIIEEKDYVEYG